MTANWKAPFRSVVRYTLLWLDYMCIAGFELWRALSSFQKRCWIFFLLKKNVLVVLIQTVVLVIVVDCLLRKKLDVKTKFFLSIDSRILNGSISLYVLRAKIFQIKFKYTFKNLCSIPGDDFD